MTEKLTYDPTPGDAPEFTEDEQNSLEVAERLGQEENELLAGKFQNAEELENAYIELQKKLGSSDGENLDDDEVEDTTLDEDEEVEYDEATVAGVNLIQDASQEYYDNEGALSAETMEEFGKMDAKDLVNAFVAIQENSPETMANEAQQQEQKMQQMEMLKQAGSLASAPAMDPSKNPAMAESFKQQFDQVNANNQGEPPNTGEEEAPPEG